MSVLVKKIMGREYAYNAYRLGGKIVHKYLGPVSDPSVKARVERLRMERKVPENFKYLFWDTDPARINIRKHSRYIIERVLEMGGLDSFRWIQGLYPTRAIIEVCDASRKISEKSKNFWRVWLHNAS